MEGDNHPRDSDRTAEEGLDGNAEDTASAAGICSLKSADSKHSATAEFHAMVKVRIFWNPHDNKEIYPSGHLWLEPVDDLRQDDIPSTTRRSGEWTIMACLTGRSLIFQLSLVTEAKRRRRQEAE